MLCTNIVLNVKTKTKNNFCTKHVVNFFFLEFNEQSLVILWITGARMRASEKDLPVLNLGRLCSARKNFSSVIPEAFCQHTRLTSYIFVLKCVNAWEKTYNSFSLTFFLRRVKD